MFVIGGKAREEKTTRKPTRSAWMDNIKIDHAGLRKADVDWIGLAQDRDRWRALVNMVMNILEP
jgi:hypothetical protein